MQEMQETRAQSVGQEDPLEQEMAPRSSNLAWKIPWAENPDGLQFMHWTQLRDWAPKAHTHFYVKL